MQKNYRILVLLFPLVYLVHNIEEWLLLKSVYLSIIPNLPESIRIFVSDDPERILSFFWIAIIVATLLPVAVLPFLFGKATSSKVQVMLVIAFATMINAISHISSSVGLGFISPGLITGVVLCLPYSFAIVVYSKKNFQIPFSRYMVLLIIAFPVYVLAIALSWLLGYFLG